MRIILLYGVWLKEFFNIVHEPDSEMEAAALRSRCCDCISQGGPDRSQMIPTYHPPRASSFMHCSTLEKAIQYKFSQRSDSLKENALPNLIHCITTTYTTYPRVMLREEGKPLYVVGTELAPRKIRDARYFQPQDSTGIILTIGSIKRRQRSREIGSIGDRKQHTPFELRVILALRIGNPTDASIPSWNIDEREEWPQRERDAAAESASSRRLVRSRLCNEFVWLHLRSWIRPVLCEGRVMRGMVEARGSWLLPKIEGDRIVRYFIAFVFPPKINLSYSEVVKRARDRGRFPLVLRPNCEPDPIQPKAISYLRQVRVSNYGVEIQ